MAAKVCAFRTRLRDGTIGHTGDDPWAGATKILAEMGPLLTVQIEPNVSEEASLVLVKPSTPSASSKRSRSKQKDRGRNRCERHDHVDTCKHRKKKERDNVQVGPAIHTVVNAPVPMS